jgi:RNA polymerase sigma factor (sigma-70 family)
MTTAVRVSLCEILDSGTLTGLTEAELLERYLTVRDERAFEMIVTRHARMVLGVCRRILHDPNDVDDAFQATFLVLVRKAASIRSRERLSPWLYGVAQKVASRARAVASARRAREGLDGAFDRPGRSGPEAASELCAILDAELSRLPEKYRSAVLLCCLEGKSHDEAAAELNWPVGTVRSRLFRGRRLLQSRLTRRGISPSLVLASDLTSVLPPNVAPDPSLIEASLQIANRLANARLVASGTVAALTQGVLTTMFVTKLKLVGGTLLAASAIGSGAMIFAQESPGRPQRAETVEPPRIANPELPPRKPGAIETDASRAANPLTDPTRSVPTNELRARLKYALLKQARLEASYKRNVVGREAVDDASSQVDILKAQIDDDREALQNAIELQKISVERLKAELDRRANVLSAKQKVFDRSRKMLQAKSISSQESDEAQADFADATAQFTIKKLEISEASVRLAQLERRLKRIDAEPVAEAPAPERNDAARPARELPR